MLRCSQEAIRQLRWDERGCRPLRLRLRQTVGVWPCEERLQQGVARMQLGMAV